MEHAFHSNPMVSSPFSSVEISIANLLRHRYTFLCLSFLWFMDFPLVNLPRGGPFSGFLGWPCSEGSRGVLYLLDLKLLPSSGASSFGRRCDSLSLSNEKRPWCCSRRVISPHILLRQQCLLQPRHPISWSKTRPWVWFLPPPFVAINSCNSSAAAVAELVGGGMETWSASYFTRWRRLCVYVCDIHVPCCNPSYEY